ncbi:multidrug resistance protein 4 [Punctularia strigosozonata HHB-11173 SS5]|uniref:multidrug resistance protein 4 n=1 Tax=Punctularia strigosozonata (strain HHB-11173) TaxID=741275 RepID=UPI0004417445|nr:multidrug resistance protein 4 [Punctularia strigosozonata HHB-11173 SS5]EIN10549.1 multidrug resistance protein 4 [Punctularia strigosozonata HHB-11173 SS5]
MPSREHSPDVQKTATSSTTQAEPADVRSTGAAATPPSLRKGEGEDAVPEDKAESVYERLEDDWQHDPRNPRNWSSSRKVIATTIVSYYTFVSPLASSMMAPGLPAIASHYNITSSTIIAMTLSIFLLSFAIGPLILAPVSEMYGRTWVLHIGNLFFLCFNLGCAYAPTTGSLIGLRFLAGFAGSAPIAVGGGSVSDMFSEKDRAGAMAAYTLGPLIGPAIGPLIGGYVAQNIGFPWVFKIIACLCGLGAAIGIPFLRETYAPVIRMRLAARSGNPEEAAKRHPHLQTQHGSKIHVLWLNLTRPFILLTRSYVCLLLSMYMGLNYGIYYLMFATFPDIFEIEYGFSTGAAGIAYLGLGLGFCLATAIGGKVGNTLYHNSAAKNGGKAKPEMRLPTLIAGAIIVPIGIFWYGWSAQAKVHFMMPIIGTGIFGFGLMMTFLPIQLYLVDSFVYAASALAAASVVRSLFGFIFPLFATQMFNALGNGGGNSLLGGLAIVLGIPFSVFLYIYGERIRSKSDLTRQS